MLKMLKRSAITLLISVTLFSLFGEILSSHQHSPSNEAAVSARRHLLQTIVDGQPCDYVVDSLLNYSDDRHGQVADYRPEDEDETARLNRRTAAVNRLLQTTQLIGQYVNDTLSSMMEVRQNYVRRYEPWPYVKRYSKVIIDSEHLEKKCGVFNEVQVTMYKYAVFLSHLWHTEQIWDGSIVPGGCNLTRDGPSFSSHLNNILVDLQTFACDLNRTMEAYQTVVSNPKAGVEFLNVAHYQFPFTHERGDRVAKSVLETFANDFLVFVTNYMEAVIGANDEKDNGAMLLP